MKSGKEEHRDGRASVKAGLAEAEKGEDNIDDDLGALTEYKSANSRTTHLVHVVSSLTMKVLLLGAARMMDRNAAHTFALLQQSAGRSEVAVSASVE